MIYLLFLFWSRNCFFCSSRDGCRKKHSFATSIRTAWRTSSSCAGPSGGIRDTGASLRTAAIASSRFLVSLIFFLTSTGVLELHSMFTITLLKSKLPGTRLEWLSCSILLCLRSSPDQLHLGCCRSGNELAEHWVVLQQK